MSHQPVKEYCKRGHLIAVSGRYVSGECRLCAQRRAALKQDIYQERAKRIYEEVAPAPGLRELRRSLGVSTKELAEESGVPLRTVRYVEVGRPTSGETRLALLHGLWYLREQKLEEAELERERKKWRARAGLA